MGVRRDNGNPRQFGTPEGMEERPSGLTVPMHAEAKLIVAKERQKKKSMVGMTERMRSGIDLGTEEGLHRAVGNIVATGSMGLKEPSVRQAYVPWYDRVHEHVSKSIAGPSVPGAKGRRSTGWTHEQASHMISAVSPGMEWGSQNIHALDAMKHLGEKDWEVIAHSAQRRTSQNRLMPRTPQAAEVLGGASAHPMVRKYLNASKDQELYRAHRIQRGDPIHEVFSQEGSPKTTWFARTIHDPSLADYEFYPHAERPASAEGEKVRKSGKKLAVLDYRAVDIAHNKMAPTQWTNRPIKNVPSKRDPSALTGYEQHAKAYQIAAGALGLKRADQAQALTWGTGKEMIEQAGTTKAGTARKQGPTRVGQPYYRE